MGVISEPIVEYRGIFIEEGQTRVCTQCKLEKDLKTGFHFHSASGYFLGECRECLSIKRREKYKNREIKLIEVANDEYKVCKTCGINKNIVKDYYLHKGINSYLSDCKDCFNKKRREKLKNGESAYAKTRSLNRFDIKNRSKRMKHSYRTYDKKRSLETDVSSEYIEEVITEKKCTYCGYQATGLDRIDNSKGHTKENCVPACYDCNTARMDNFSHEEMLILGETIKEIKDKR